MLSPVRLFATPWTVAHQAPLSMGILQARILEWVAMPSSRGSSQVSIQVSNPGLPHCRQILYRLSHQGSPRMLEWVACPFSTESSQPRNQTRIACNAGRFFPNWATNSSLNKQTKKLELKQQERKERREKGRGEGRKERDHQSICFSNFPSFVPTLCSY